MTPIRVGVLRGGPSSEYERSLDTGKTVLEQLHAHADYLPVDIFIDKGVMWHMEGTPIDPADLHVHVDVVVNALHGAYGEDGKVQHILESLKLPYTGSGVIASALSMHKERAKQRFKQEGIPVAPSAIFSLEKDTETKLRDIFRSIPGPYVIKPLFGVSSVGVRFAESYPQLHEAVYEITTTYPEVMIEKYLRGREASCGIIDAFRGEAPYALIPVEIVLPDSTRKLFEHEVPFPETRDALCPGRFSREEITKIQEYAKRAHRTLGARDYSQSDFIVTPKDVYILETDSLPPLTSNSLLAKSLHAIGSGVVEFLHHSISRANSRR